MTTDHQQFTQNCESALVGPSVIMVIHTWPQENPGRIISARRATRHERRIYEEGNGQTD